MVAPALNASLTPTGLTVLEGDSDPSGLPIAQIVADGSISDADLERLG